MNVEMTLPDLSTTGTSVKIIRWLVDAGQAIKRGQPLLEVETDKSTMEIEAYLSGVLVEILADADAEVEVGQVIALIATEPESRPAAQPGSAAPGMVTPGTATASPNAASVSAQAAATPARTGMFARNRQKAAQETATSIPAISNVEDTRPAQVSASLPPQTWTQSIAQRVVAQRMLESKQTIPHFYLQTSANAGPAARRRNAAVSEKPLWDAFFISAAGKALKKYPRLCASFIDGQLKPQAVDSIGVAVDLEGDLFVCPVANPAGKTPELISTEITSWIQRLRSGDPLARIIQPGNLTVTNLGGTGVESFTAVINPPEGAILAVGKSRRWWRRSTGRWSSRTASR
jgi:pyruvate dehydrogenase E2 component (dihydrolipoamide acetyltransferase)